MSFTDRQVIGRKHEQEVVGMLRVRGFSVAAFELPAWFLNLLGRTDTNLRRLPDLAAYHTGRQDGPFLVDPKAGLTIEEKVMLSHRALLDGGFGADVFYVYAAGLVASITEVERNGETIRMPSGDLGRLLYPRQCRAFDDVFGYEGG